MESVASGASRQSVCSRSRRQPARRGFLFLTEAQRAQRFDGCQKESDGSIELLSVLADLRRIGGNCLSKGGITEETQVAGRNQRGNGAHQNSRIAVIDSAPVVYPGLGGVMGNRLMTRYCLISRGCRLPLSGFQGDRCIEPLRILAELRAKLLEVFPLGDTAPPRSQTASAARATLTPATITRNSPAKRRGLHHRDWVCSFTGASLP